MVNGSAAAEAVRQTTATARRFINSGLARLDVELIQQLNAPDFYVERFAAGQFEPQPELIIGGHTILIAISPATVAVSPSALIRKSSSSARSARLA
jgi:hypothetical protein